MNRNYNMSEYDKKDYNPNWPTLRRIGEPYRPTEKEINNSILETGLDFTRKTGSLQVQLTDTGPNGRPWNMAQIDLQEIAESGTFFVWSFDNDYLLFTVIDAKLGHIRAVDNGRQARFIFAQIVDFIKG